MNSSGNVTLLDWKYSNYGEMYGLLRYAVLAASKWVRHRTDNSRELEDNKQ
jgi:hypothetical protein